MKRFLPAILIAAVCRAQSSTPVPSTFFAMSAVDGDYPKPLIGTLAHQSFAWITIERSRGNFNFKEFDDYMAAAQQHGLVDAATNTANFAMTLAAGTPSWALADRSTCPAPTGVVQCTAPPDNIQDWKDFLSAVIRHYDGKTQPHIRYYELWNEANISKWWTGSAAQMAALGQAAYAIVHQDPYSMLLTPSVAGPVGNVSADSGTTWMTGYLQAGGAKYADGGAFHGYLGAQSGLSQFPMPEQDTAGNCKVFVGCYGSIITKATQMRAVFDQNGLAGKAMYQTEGSWGNGNVTDPDTQVAWLARFNLLQAGLRSTLNLQMAAWFTWGGGTTFGWGTIETDALDPNPAGLAYSQIYNWVAGASMDRPCAGASNGTWTCALARPGGYTALAVWDTNGAASFPPPAGATQYRDLTGNITPIPAGAGVPIGAKPVLVESLPPGMANPAITLVANAAGESRTVAPNTWIEIKGSNLAPAGDTRTWAAADFAGGRMPAQLDGVRVTVNGRSAFVYYISPTQVNVLTSPDAMQGTVQVQLTSGGLSSAPFAVQAQPAAPAFFVFGGGPYAAAVHADGSLLAPVSLYPGLSAPARPGETVMLFANGFGATSGAVVNGSSAQTGTLSSLPAVQIGGIAATVTFAGLVAPGEFQFNVAIPAGVAPGDQPLIATYQGASTQSGVLIPIAAAP